jgi:hypothetical protein
MVAENFTGFFLPEALINQLTVLTVFFQAVGGLILLYIVFGVLNAIWNRRRVQETVKMRQLLEQINKKLDKPKKK